MDASTPALSTKIQEDIIKILSVTQVVSQVKKKKNNQKNPNKIGEMFWFSLYLNVVTNIDFRPSLFYLEVE